MQNQGGTTAASTSAAYAALGLTPPAEATRILALKDAVTLEELANDEEYVDIVQDMRDECAKVRRNISRAHVHSFVFEAGVQKLRECSISAKLSTYFPWCQGHLTSG